MLPVTYKGKDMLLEFYLCSSLEREVYLGIDFWRIFNIVSDVISVNELDVEKIQTEYPKPGSVNIKMHDLSADQQQKLERIKEKTFENDGLDRTNVEKHTTKSIPDAVLVYVAGSTGTSIQESR